MARSPSQDERQIAISMPSLGKDVLLFHHMTGREEIGRLFEYELDVLSRDHDLKLEDVVGKNITVTLDLPHGGTRHFNGYVTRFSYAGTHGEYSRYVTSVRPWLWFLTLRSDCRIYQDVTVPDIIEDTCSRHGFVQIENRLKAEHRQWEYCVQYRETDFAFVSRLMEQEGIYYYFQHEDGKHTLVLCDGSSAHRAADGYDDIPYHPPEQQTEGLLEHVFAWTVSRHVAPVVIGLGDFDFKGPRVNLDTKISALAELQLDGLPTQSELELYDYPGEYVSAEEGEAYARVRIEELEAQYEVAEGQSNARGVTVGNLFKLTDHPRGGENREYLILSAAYELHSDAYQTGADADTLPVFRCAFRALDSRRRFRSPRTTPLPTVPGPQTAIVVGPAGEKIWPDKYGRVKVQFHWDRYGQRDENSSCWIRVSQNWAGGNWGGMNIPHVGQEVVVEFLEGDPDRPLITGRVYNADNMPPFKLPDNKHKSILRDDFGNEIVFDATPGKEHIWLHSPHHDSSLAVGQSVKYSSSSDQDSVILGVKNDWVLGMVTDTKLGQKSELVGGSAMNMRLGAMFEATSGWSTSVSADHKLEITYADDVSLNIDDYHKQIGDYGLIDARKTFQLVAGENRNSRIKMTGSTIEIENIVNVPRTGLSTKEDLKTFRRQLAAMAIAAASLSTAQAIAVPVLAKRQADASETGASTWTYVIGALHAALNVYAGIMHLWVHKKHGDVNDIGKETDTKDFRANITLNDKGHVVIAGKKIALRPSGAGDLFVFDTARKTFKTRCKKAMYGGALSIEC